MTGGDPVVVPPADPEPDTAAPVGPPPNTEPLDDGGPYRGFASAAEVSGLPMTESPADDPRNRRVVLTITCT